MAVEPHEVLGVSAQASRDEIARAYRDLAKRFHPDRATGDEVARTRRMAEVNAAKDALLGRWDAGGAGAWGTATGGRGGGGGRGGRGGGMAGDGADDPAQPQGAAVFQRRPPARGEWLPPEVRARMARELIGALRDGEQVHLVVRTAMRDSHEVQLAATDDRLLWLRDDAISDRVRSLAYDRIAGLEPRRARVRRNVAELRVLTRAGRRIAFGELTGRQLDALVVTLSRRAGST